MTFLPKDLTVSESDLLATLTDQLYSKRSPQTPEQKQAVGQEAMEIAAEMIWAQRAELGIEEAAVEEAELDEALADSPYHQRQAGLRDRLREIQEEEDRDREASEAR